MRRRQQADPERRSYLQQLVTEFQDTNSRSNKQQVLANLANFAYDPMNYDFLRQLNVIDIFLDQLSVPDDQLVEFAIGGLCNLALDPVCKERIRRKDGVRLLIDCLSSAFDYIFLLLDCLIEFSSSVEEVVLSSITTLMFLITPDTRNAIVTPPVVDYMQRYSQSSNRRLSNLANIFINDFCTSKDSRGLCTE